MAPGSNEYHVRVELYRRASAPFGSINIERVDLDLENERINLLLLLGNEYQLSNRNIKLRAVLKEHVEKVIQELQAWYERSQKAGRKGK